LGENLQLVPLLIPLILIPHSNILNQEEDRKGQPQPSGSLGITSALKRMFTNTGKKKKKKKSFVDSSSINAFG